MTSVEPIRPLPAVQEAGVLVRTTADPYLSALTSAAGRSARKIVP